MTPIDGSKTARIVDAAPLHLVLDGDDPGFSVIEAEANFALCELFEVRVLVQHTEASLMLRPMLQRQAVLFLDCETFTRKIEGIVRRARVVSTEPNGVSRYELLLVPAMWLLTRRRNHRIFRGLNVPAIVTTLAREHPPAASKLAAALTKAHPMRDYTVQYGEDDAHAAFRLLADEGITSLFAVAEGSELVLLDDTTSQTPVLPDALPFVAPGISPPATPHVLALRSADGVTPRRAAIRDYDYENPAYIIDGLAGTPRSDTEDLEYYEYEVGEISDDTAALGRASNTLDALASEQRTVCLSSDLIHPGTRFRVSEAPRSDGNVELLVIASRSRWSVDAASSGETTVRTHELTCMNSAKPFKPRRLEKPRIAGVQTGLVVGEPGKEIDVDAEGRVEVEFRWDRRDLHGIGASRRVRVSQAWAGLGYGLMTVPRVNDEVIVAYLDGDPDQPIIVGRVHNPARPSPLKLPDDQTVSAWRSRSTPGGDGYNEILMDDLAGKERLEMHAQLDFTQLVERDAGITVRRNSTTTVHGDKQTNVVGKGDSSYADGFSFSTQKDGNIAVPNGSFTILAAKLGIISGPRQDDVSGQYSINVTGDTDWHDTGNYNHSAHGAYYHVDDVFKVDGPYFHVYAGSGIRLVCGGSIIELTPSSITIQSSGPVVVNGAPIKLNC